MAKVTMSGEMLSRRTSDPFKDPRAAPMLMPVRAASTVLWVATATSATMMPTSANIEPIERST